MVNSTQLDISTESLGNITLNDIIRVTVFVPTFILFGIFLYFASIIMKVFLRNPRIHENARYILFIHMLANDVMYITSAFLFYFGSSYHLYWPLPLCFLIISFNTSSFRVTPYNLAVMSLERYAAICHPLRHAELCTVKRSKIAMVAMWVVGFVPQISSFITFCFTAENKMFSLNVICDWPSITISQAQAMQRTVADVLSFVLVAGIIAYTSLRVIMVAHKVGSAISAAKAGKTVLLHAFQLLLCMFGFTYGFTEKYLRQYFYLLPLMNFLLFMCFPRLISPLIYGIRDEVFSKYMTTLCRSQQSSSL